MPETQTETFPLRGFLAAHQGETTVVVAKEHAAMARAMLTFHGQKSFLLNSTGTPVLYIERGKDKVCISLARVLLGAQDYQTGMQLDKRKLTYGCATRTDLSRILRGQIYLGARPITAPAAGLTRRARRRRTVPASLVAGTRTGRIDRAPLENAPARPAEYSTVLGAMLRSIVREEVARFLKAASLKVTA